MPGAVRFMAVAAAAYVLLGLASDLTARARDADVPMINLDQRCRDSQRVMEMLGTNTAPADIFQGCKNGEEQALKQIREEWSKIPANVKSRCIAPMEFSPSYIEWQSCVEVDRDVRQIRKESSAGIAPPKICPVIEIRQDGSVSSVLACELSKFRR